MGYLDAQASQRDAERAVAKAKAKREQSRSRANQAFLDCPLSLIDCSLKTVFSSFVSPGTRQTACTRRLKLHSAREIK